MIWGREKQKQLEEFGATIEKAIEDIGIIVQFPDNLKEVVYTDEPYILTTYDSPHRVYTMKIVYRDDGKVKRAKMERLDAYKKQLKEELDRISEEMDGAL